MLGRALERARLDEPFDWGPWDSMGRGRRAASSAAADGISGQQAIRMTRQWWEAQRRRGPSAEATWEVDYRQPLAPLVQVPELEASHLLALVDSAQPATRSRLRAARTAIALIRALGWGDGLANLARWGGENYHPPVPPLRLPRPPRRCRSAPVGRPTGARCGRASSLKPNSLTLGAHGANAGYVVAEYCHRQGIGSRLCQHSLQAARRLGFRAMQFNLEVTTNSAGIRCWERNGFRIVGTLPGSFRHQQLGYMDA